MRRRAKPRSDAGARSDGVAAAPQMAARGPRSAAGRWLRAAAVTVAITFTVLLAASGSLLIYMSTSAQGGRPTYVAAKASPSAAPTATNTPLPWATATPIPSHGTAQSRSMSRDVSLGCGHGAPAPWPSAITSGAYGSTPNEVALTFDDGPTPYSTPAILTVLEQTHTPATFFVEGQYVSSWPNLLEREWGDGFAIGLHTWNHPPMTTLSVSQQQWQLSSTLTAIHNILGGGTCLWFWRPPYGDYNAQVLQSAASFGLTTVTWDDDPQDWARPGVSTIVSRVLAQVHPGSIILMHDGPALRQETADALPAILAGLQARGLHPVTLPKLLSDGSYPGVHPLAAPIAPLPSSSLAGVSVALRDIRNG